MWCPTISQIDVIEYVSPVWQGWYSPDVPGGSIPNDHHRYYQYNITSIPNPFFQEADEIYWLELCVDADPWGWGWKTADVDQYPDPYTGGHFMDDAVWRGEATGWAWQELYEPPDFEQSLDLAFVITGWDHKMHFPQLPDPTGWDVRAFCLEDDWECSETGSVTDIHFWGSWHNDEIGEITDI